MESMIFGGIAIHALGGIAAASCYISQKGAPKWSFQTYWIIVSLTAWLLMPLIVSAITVPELMMVLQETPRDVALKVFLFGAAYGFGGMAFGVALRHIGFSLTYAIAIGISAIFGTVVPAIINGTLISHFQKPGGLVVLAGFVMSVAGVAVCGRAGFMKEGELASETKENSSTFSMKKGLWLVVLAGILSGVFGVGVATGSEIDLIATAHKAKQGFAGYPKYIFLTGGTLLTNLIWWGVVCVRKRSLGEFIKHEDGFGKLSFYYLMGIIGGVLWFTQFIFYEQGHARMGDFKFISWGIHMAMLVFFSFGVGLIFREWHNCTRRTHCALALGMLVLVTSFGLITYGSWVGEKAAAAGASAEVTTGQWRENMKRYGSVIGVKEEKIEEYKRLHADVWPDVLKIIEDCNIHNYSIYLRKLPDGKNYLFSYFEYTGDDFAADCAKMAAHPTTQKWWDLCIPCQEPLADRAEGEWWADMEEVFHCD